MYEFRLAVNSVFICAVKLLALIRFLRCGITSDECLVIEILFGLGFVIGSSNETERCPIASLLDDMVRDGLLSLYSYKFSLVAIESHAIVL
jgi:hypothetical protein